MKYLFLFSTLYQIYIERKSSLFLPEDCAFQFQIPYNNYQLRQMRLSPYFYSYFSKVKVYYPFFLSSDYSPLQYSPYYGQKATGLAVDKPNQFQVNYNTLPKYLEKQIQEDKCLFYKEKQLLFVGRSNSGKSSLINEIFKGSVNSTKKKIARVSKKPGTTQFLHFHHILNKDSFIVDAPGYGYAKMNRRRRELWFGLTQEYLKISSRLSQIFVCINLQHGLKQSDYLFLKRCDKYNIDVQLVITKVDKISPQKYFYQLQSIVEAVKRHQLKKVNQRIIAVSSKTGFGIEVMRMRLIEAIEQSQQRNIDQKEDLLLAYVKELKVQRTQIQHKQPTQSKQFLVRKLIYNSKLTKYLK